MTILQGLTSYSYYWMNTVVLIAIIGYLFSQWLDKKLNSKRLILQVEDAGQGENRLPKYATQGSSGKDICIFNPLVLKSKETKIVSAHIRVVIPKGYELQVRSRSGKGSKGLVVAQGIGTIDSDYRGEIKVALYNRTDGNINLKAGEAVAQLVLCPVVQYDWEFLSREQFELLESTDRGEGGFGSTDELQMKNKLETP